jgi:hypothetical protein
MSYGILSGKSKRVFSGLGAEPPPAPWCWGAAGYAWGAAFDACHAKNWKTCDGQNYELKLAGKPQMTKTQFDDCVYIKDNMNCDCPGIAPTAKAGATATPASTAGKLTMGNKTSDPRVAELQRAINATLVPKGYLAISTDGKLGPGTCGAAREADNFGAGLMAKYGLTGVCTSFTTPAKSGGGVTSSGGGAPPTLVAPAPTTISPTSSAGFLGMNMPTLLLVAAAGIGAYVFLGPKKGAQKAA